MQKKKTNVIFIGNRDGDTHYYDHSKEARLYDELYTLIKFYPDNALEFYFTIYSPLNYCASRYIDKICQKLRKDCTKTFVIPYLDQKDEYLQSACDFTFYPSLETVPLKFAISAMNDWLLKKADVVIANVRYKNGNAGKLLRKAKRKVKQPNPILLLDLQE